MMDRHDKIFVAGHKGLVGSAIIRGLQERGHYNISVCDKNNFDLRDRTAVDAFMKSVRPKYVFLAAAKVGGIGFNKSFPADFIYDNLSIQTNVIDSSYAHGVEKLCFLGSACIYPKLAEVPIKEEALLTGPLEETNIGYAIAKIAGLIMCQKYKEQYGFNCISVMPNNLYGINDNFNVDQCHVIPAFINKFIYAKENNLPSVTCFGDGSPTREFLYADDLAEGLIYLMNNYDDAAPINVGPDREVSIKELATMIANTVGYTGKIEWDTTMPNGTPRRKLDNSKMKAMGWKPKTPLEEGLKTTIEWYMMNRETYDRI